MTSLGVVVEGQTEEEFVLNVLAEHFAPKQIRVDPKLIGEARRYGDGGGNVSISELVEDMVILSETNDFVTSLVDFYGFMNKGEMDADQLEEAILSTIQEDESLQIRSEKFVPYVQMHEFEGLLFSDTASFASIETSEDSIMKLEEVRGSFATPEDINDNSETAPSKRIKKEIPLYRKRRFGYIVAEAIGISKIREECPRFNEWLAKLEALGS